MAVLLDRQEVRTAKLQTVIDAGEKPADPDERRTRGTHSLAEHTNGVSVMYSVTPHAGPTFAHQRWRHAVVESKSFIAPFNLRRVDGTLLSG